MADAIYSRALAVHDTVFVSKMRASSAILEIGNVEATYDIVLATIS